MEEVDPGWLTHYAHVLGVDRTGWYRPANKQRIDDAAAITLLQAAHAQHPFYGVRRLALHLHWSENKARRIRSLAGVRIPRASKKYKYRRGLRPEIAAPANALRAYAVFKDATRPQDGMDYSNMVNAEAWVQDFTHIWFEGAWCYLAVVMSLKTREVVGWRVGTNHSGELTYAALLDALSKHSGPAILHSDQGSEYLSHSINYCVNVWKYVYPLVLKVVPGRTASWNDGLVTSNRNYHTPKIYKV